MAKTEMFTPDEIAIIQARQLRKTIYYLYQRSPFYRDVFDRERILPADIKSLDDLRYLPTTSREDLLREEERFLCVRPEEVADIMTTSGAAGNPCFFKVTESDLSRLAYNEQLSAKMVGIEEKDSVALALCLDACSMAGLACYFGLRRMGVTVARIGHLPLEQILRFLEHSKPTVMIGMPSFLKSISVYAEKQGISLRRHQVRKLVCVDEPIRQRNFVLNDLGAYLARTWNAKLFSAYRSTELSTSLSECEESCGGHLHPELLHLEVIDEYGHPVPEGEIGELCVTPFGVTGMPVLRYRTGDYTFVRTRRCGCGRWTLRLGPILGQRGAKLNIRGNIVFPGDIHGIVQGNPDIRSHVILLETERDGSDKVTLLLAAENSRLCERIEERIYQNLGVHLPSRLVSEKEIKALQMAEVYAKPRLMIDRRQINS